MDERSAMPSAVSLELSVWMVMQTLWLIRLKGNPIFHRRLTTDD